MAEYPALVELLLLNSSHKERLRIQTPIFSNKKTSLLGFTKKVCFTPTMEVVCIAA